MKNVNLIDKVVYYIAQALTAFGMLTLLFLPMMCMTVSLNGISSSASYTLFDAMSSSTAMTETGLELEDDGSGVAVLVLFIIAMCLAAIELIYVCYALVKKKEAKLSIVVCFALAATVVSLVMFIICNVEFAKISDMLNELVGSYSSYLNVNYSITSGWIGTLIICTISMAAPLIYCYGIRPRLNAATVAEAAAASVAVPAAQPKAKDDKSAIEAIKAYKQLLDEGAITEEEFQKKKEELM